MRDCIAAKFLRTGDHFEFDGKELVVGRVQHGTEALTIYTTTGSQITLLATEQVQLLSCFE